MAPLPNGLSFIPELTMTTKNIEESEVGTAKDYAHQIITAFKHLEHGVSYFHDQPVMEAGEEDMMYDIIINALTQHHEAEVERAYENGQKSIMLKANELTEKPDRAVRYVPLDKLMEFYQAPITPDNQ